LQSLLWYKTIKVVEIHNWKLGLLHYGIQFAILLYVFVYVIGIKKGYQGTGTLIGSTNIKVKGNAFIITDGNYQIWDEHDAIQPAKEVDAFFVTTNFQITYSQSRGVCVGQNKDSFCNATIPCPPNKSLTM